MPTTRRPKHDGTVIDVRTATSDDDDAVIALLRTCLGKKPEDPYERYFAWKHRENPFGPSPAWVACERDRIVGYRTLLRWSFVDGHGHGLTAVRAVDTATDPEYRGAGIFTKLTRAAVDQLTVDGVDLIFNTPNDQSRPGYLKMGWQSLGRLPVAVRPRSVGGAARMMRARAPADLWASATSAGIPTTEALADPGVATLLADLPAATGLTTDRSVAYLRWRYGLSDLGYRAFAVGGAVTDGMLIGRVRARGSARELGVCEVLCRTRAAARAALAAALADSRADYAIGLGRSRVVPMVPLPRQGPILTWRPLSEAGRGLGVTTAATTSASGFGVSLGDVELF